MRLPAGAVHIWRADLDAVGARVERLLDEQERERAARIVREPARRRWMAARGTLRSLLGGYLDEDPAGLRLARETRGKPVLDLPGAERLNFNVSHSGGLAVYALTEMCSVGVDVELVGHRARATRQPNETALARRVLESAVAERLHTLEPRARRRELLRAWVRHEADRKRLGAGVWSTPARARMEDPRPWIAELDLGRDDHGREAVGAVALALAPVDFQVYAIDFRACRSILQASTLTTRLDGPNVPG